MPGRRAAVRVGRPSAGEPQAARARARLEASVGSMTWLVVMAEAPFRFVSGDLGSARTRVVRTTTAYPVELARSRRGPRRTAPGFAENELINPWDDTTNRLSPGQRRMCTEARTPRPCPAESFSSETAGCASITGSMCAGPPGDLPLASSTSRDVRPGPSTRRRPARHVIARAAHLGFSLLPDRPTRGARLKPRVKCVPAVEVGS